MMPEPSGQHPYKDAPLFDDVAFLTGALQTVLAAQTDCPVQEAVAALLGGEAPQDVVARSLPQLNDQQLEDLQPVCANPQYCRRCAPPASPLSAQPNPRQRQIHLRLHPRFASAARRKRRSLATAA